jgi:hypothetical protein
VEQAFTSLQIAEADRTFAEQMTWRPGASEPLTFVVSDVFR